MNTLDRFYPGFELAGLETPWERALVGAACAVVVIAQGLKDATNSFASRWRSPAATAFDG